MATVALDGTSLLRTAPRIVGCRSHAERRTVMDMTPLRARVRNGRLHLDEPTELPDGTELDLVVDDEGDDLTEHERRTLHEVLSRSWTSAEAGRLRPASALIDELRRKR